MSESRDIQLVVSVGNGERGFLCCWLHIWWGGGMDNELTEGMGVSGWSHLFYRCERIDVLHFVSWACSMKFWLFLVVFSSKICLRVELKGFAEIVPASVGHENLSSFHHCCHDSETAASLF